MSIRYPRDIWTFLLITAVTVLIWYWAAGETRVERSLPVRVQFRVAEAEAWLIEPAARAINLNVEGSQRAIRNATQSLTQLTLPIDPTAGPLIINVAEELRNHSAVRETGVTIISVDPRMIELNVDRIVTENVPVVAQPPPGVEVAAVEPSEVQLTMPRRVRDRLPADLRVEAFIDRGELSRLQPGLGHAQDVRVRLPEQYPSREAITIEPPAARVTFTIRSQIQEHTLDLVRINLAGPPEDHEYIVELEPGTLRDVTISASSDLIARIMADEATVVAFLHLKSTEKDMRLERKPVTCFMALLPDGRAQPVELKSIGESTAWPVITLTITDRPEG